MRAPGVLDEVAIHGEVERTVTPNWVANSFVLWSHRRFLVRTAGISLALGLVFAFTMPKHYKSSARIMPPSNSGNSTAMLAALAGRAIGGGSASGLGGLASSLLGSSSTAALFVDLLHSGSIAEHLIQRYDLQRIYHKRYRVDTVKYLTKHTTVLDDKKSGVITITVDDTDPRRARDLAQGYLDELNLLLNRTSTSTAHQERVFLEKRLKSVQADLEEAQEGLSEFSSTHSTVDIHEQGRALVDAASRLQAQMIVEESSLNSLRQIYGDANVRVRAAESRIAVLRTQLEKMSGSSAPLVNGGKIDESSKAGNNSELYPALRQLPRLAVPYTNLYRKVQIQETVFELLTQQYELARLQEAKDVPVLSVIDAPGIPEKKSFPPRLLVGLLACVFATGAAAVYLLMKQKWMAVDEADARKMLVREITGTLQRRVRGAR